MALSSLANRRLARGVHAGLRWISVLLIALSLVYSAALLSLKTMGYEISVVVSDSMQPVAQRGDLLLTQQGENFSVGEVVLFRRADTQVVHRLVERVAGGWRTQGDANPVRDPWVVNDADIVGRAVGVLRAMGLPMLWAQGLVTPATHGGFTTSHTSASAAAAAHWNTPSMSWTVYANSSVITRIPPAIVYLNGSGERRIYSATRYSTSSRVFVEGKLSLLDPTAPQYTVLLNGCVSAADLITCGWLISVNHITKRITLQLATGNTTRSAVLAYCSLPATSSLANSHTLSVHKVGSSLYVLFNGSSCLKVFNVNTLATGFGLSAPTGSFTGVTIAATNRLEATRLIVW